MKNDEYRRQAADAPQEADKASNDRAAWLRVAQGYLSLIRKRPQSEEQAFEARSRAEGTGQPRSDASN
ncbi:hypothetical protein AAE026_39005 [Bradyrhizobium sp. DN5]|uniref:hypothetical protein n=1 Tax=Bradyrhizobium sp. DN5 TaxID=3056950 RepID=UPI003523C0A5